MEIYQVKRQHSLRRRGRDNIYETERNRTSCYLCLRSKAVRHQSSVVRDRRALWCDECHCQCECGWPCDSDWCWYEDTRVSTLPPSIVTTVHVAITASQSTTTSLHHNIINITRFTCSMFIHFNTCYTVQCIVRIQEILWRAVWRGGNTAHSLWRWRREYIHIYVTQPSTTDNFCSQCLRKINVKWKTSLSQKSKVQD